MFLNNKKLNKNNNLEICEKLPFKKQHRNINNKYFAHLFFVVVNFHYLLIDNKSHVLRKTVIKNLFLKQADPKKDEENLQYKLFEDVDLGLEVYVNRTRIG